MKRELKRPVTVEDLLGLKRAERPSSDFWSEFDRRLRDKQLSALVAPRPWWRSSGWLECWHVLRRFQFPLGTSAVLALTFVAWHYDRPSVSDSHALVSPGLPFQTAEPDQLLVSPVSPVASNRQVEGAGLRIDPSEARVRSSDPEAMTPGPSAMVAEASAAGMPYAVPLLGVPVRESQESATMSSLRLEPVLSVHNEIAEVQLSRSLLSSVARFEAHLPAVRSPVEPLKQITPPAERRGARILTAMVSVGSVENAMRTTERAASRISEERLYDQIQRFGARGAGVSVKF